MKHNRRRFLGIGLVVLLVLSLGAAAVFAQADTEDDPDTNFGFRFGHFQGPKGGQNDEALAEALGISVEALQAARQEVAAQRIEEAVAEGLITREQGNTMLAMQALKSYLDRDALLAQALDMSVEEVQAAREDGTLHDILAEIAPADLQEALQTALQAAIAQAVDDNVITQEQADLVMAQMENGLGFFGHGRGRHHFGGGRGGFRAFPGGSDNMESAAPMANFQFAPAFDA